MYAQQPRGGETPKVWLGECINGSISLLGASLPGSQQSPSVTMADIEKGVSLPRGTVLRFKAVPDNGFAFECGYQAQNGQFAFFSEFFDREFEVTVNGNCSVGASFVEPEILDGITCIRDVVYAQPGVKPLKYDVYMPEGAKNLPGIVIIHGGGWRMNCEDVMSGMARELARDGKYVVFSIDYRWIGNADGDAVPNTMDQLICDCYGAVLHIIEHASEYGLNPKKIAVTGDSAGGHLSASVATMIERVGDGGFGVKEGVYEFLPTYMPARMSVRKARKALMAIKAAAPNYGIFSVSDIIGNIRNMSDGGQKAVAPINNIPAAGKRSIPHWINRGTKDPIISDATTMAYYNALLEAGQRAEYIQVPDAVHAYYDWKPDAATKATFWKYGAPYAHRMEEFFNSVFY